MKGERGNFCKCVGHLGHRQKMWQCLKLMRGRNVQILQRLLSARVSEDLRKVRLLHVVVKKKKKEQWSAGKSVGKNIDCGKQWQNKYFVLIWNLMVLSASVLLWGMYTECGVLLLQVLSGGRVLALTSAQISDTGKYTCVAVNAAGESQRDIDLRVYGEIFWLFFFFE